LVFAKLFLNSLCSVPHCNYFLHVALPCYREVVFSSSPILLMFFFSSASLCHCWSIIAIVTPLIHFLTTIGHHFGSQLSYSSIFVAVNSSLLTLSFFHFPHFEDVSIYVVVILIYFHHHEVRS
ncbi:hypothetical protein V8G54_037273, partial [Vigna mungo]